MAEYERIVHPLEPLYDKNSKIIVLGSFPSVKTREYGFFYGHPQNRFWKIMEVLFDCDLDKSIDERKNFMLEHNIAMWDTIYACDIVGSSDASIKNVVPTPLSDIVENSNIEAAFCNGATSYKYFKKYHEENLHIKSFKLPSTSPANARYSLDDLVSEWKILLNFV